MAEFDNTQNLVNALKSVATAVTGSFDLDTLLQGIVETCTKFSNASRGALFLYDQSKGSLVMRAEKGFAPGLRFNATYLINKDIPYEKSGLTPYIFNTRETLVLNSPTDITEHYAHFGKYDKEQYPGQEKCQSFIGIPLIDADANLAIGVLKIENTIDRTPSKKFSEYEKNIFIILSDIASTSISKFQKQIYKIGTSIDRLTQVLHGTGSLKIKLRNIASTFKDISHAEAASIWLKHNNGKKLVCEAGVGYFEVLEDKGMYNLDYENNNSRMGLTPWIAVSGNTVNIKSNKELNSHPQHLGKFDDDNYPDKATKKCESFIGAPLKMGDEIIGVIKADNRLPESDSRAYFSEEEAQIFSYLALITAIVVKNHQEFEKASFHDKQLIELYKIGTECSHLDTPNEIYWNLLVGLTHERGLGFNRAILFDVNDRASPVLTGRMALGPLNEAEGKLVQSNLDSGNLTVDLDACKSAYRINNGRTPQSKIQSYIETVEINLPERSDIYKKIISPRRPIVSFVSPGECSEQFCEFLEIIQSVPINNNIVLFSFLDIDSQPILGFCDYVYSLRDTDEFILKVLDTFINQISLSITRLTLTTAEEASREKAWKEFSGTTAHRIGTETSSMSGALYTIKQELLSNNISKAKEYLPNLEASLDRLVYAVKEYTELTKPPELNIQKLELNKVINDALLDVSSEVSDHIKIETNLSTDIDEFYGDYDRLKYVLKEIIHNAIVELKNGGTINIQSGIDSKNAFIEISDTGKGIVGEVLSKVFDRSVKARTHGTGLGLWIVKKYIEEHHGTVEAKNIEPHGACFTIKLPKSDIKSDGKLLVVDDTDEQVIYITAMINREFPKMHIDVAKNESDAIEYLKKNEYLHVITDIKLDEGGGGTYGGLDVLRYLRDVDQANKAIVITAHPGLTITGKDGQEVSVLDKAKELGARDCVNRVDIKYIEKLRDALVK